MELDLASRQPLQVVQARDGLVNRAMVLPPSVEIHRGRIDSEVVKHRAQRLTWAIAEDLARDHEYLTAVEVIEKRRELQPVQAGAEVTVVEQGVLRATTKVGRVIAPSPQSMSANRRCNQRRVHSLPGRSGTRAKQTWAARRRLCSWTLQEPEIKRHEHQDNSDVCPQALPELVPEEQDIDDDHDGYQREHVEHDGCLSSHRYLLLCATDVSKSGAGFTDRDLRVPGQGT
jgi:hypothetical protein